MHGPGPPSHPNLIVQNTRPTPSSTHRTQVSPPLPRHTPTISHANMELFLNTLHKNQLEKLVLEAAKSDTSLPGLPRVLKLQVAEEDCFCCWRMAMRRRLPHQQTLDTRHVNYPINLTFSASDVIQTQNMDCWRCWRLLSPATAAPFLFNCLLVTCRQYRYLVTHPDKVLHLNCEKFNISLDKATNKAFKYLACILYF